jgi:hypothetical protein
MSEFDVGLDSVQLLVNRLPVTRSVWRQKERVAASDRSLILGLGCEILVPYMIMDSSAHVKSRYVFGRHCKMAPGLVADEHELRDDTCQEVKRQTPNQTVEEFERLSSRRRSRLPCRLSPCKLQEALEDGVCPASARLPCIYAQAQVTGIIGGKYSSHVNDHTHVPPSKASLYVFDTID